MAKGIVLSLLSINMIFAAESKTPVLVSDEWLAGHLKDSNLVVLTVADKMWMYKSGHIPGARFLWVSSYATATPELGFELVPLKQLKAAMEKLGVSNSSRVVLCSTGGNVSATARAYVTMEYLGLGDRTSILDGGFEGWKAAGNPVSKETPSFKTSSLQPHLKADAIVNAEYVRKHLAKNGVAILDARAPNFYSGKDSGGFLRAGHIPGALNLYYATLFDTANRYLPLDSLTAKFAAAGIKPGDELITYCHVGQTASSAYVGAKILGYQVHLYDGSFEEWSSREDLPVVLDTRQDTSRSKMFH